MVISDTSELKVVINRYLEEEESFECVETSYRFPERDFFFAHTTNNFNPYVWRLPSQPHMNLLLT